MRLLLVLAAAAGAGCSTAPPPAPVDPAPIETDLSAWSFPEVQNPDLYGHDEIEERLFFYADGRAEAAVAVPADGIYAVTVRASCDPALGENAKFRITVGGREAAPETILTEEYAKDYTVEVPLKKGERRLGVEFTNDVFKQDEYDRNLYVQAVTLRRVK